MSEEKKPRFTEEQLRYLKEWMDLDSQDIEDQSIQADIEIWSIFILSEAMIAIAQRYKPHPDHIISRVGFSDIDLQMLRVVAKRGFQGLKDNFSHEPTKHAYTIDQSCYIYPQTVLTLARAMHNSQGAKRQLDSAIVRMSRETDFSELPQQMQELIGTRIYTLLKSRPVSDASEEMSDLRSDTFGG